MERAVIAGASGFMGRHLAAAYREAGREVVLIGRGSGSDVHWGDADGLRRALDGASVLVNLAGRTVDCRYTEANRREILDSRIDTTRELGRVIAELDAPPPVWMNASTATIYPAITAAAHTEGDRTTRFGFSEQVAQAWEAELAASPAPATRKIALRTTIALGPDSDATTMLLGLARFGLGGPQIDGWWFPHDRYRGLSDSRGTPFAKNPSRPRTSGGRQMFSWIHIDDAVAAIRHIEATESISGPVNLAAPEAVTNVELMRALRRTVGARIGLPAFRWMLEPAMRVLGTESELVLKSRWVAPGVLEETGFAFAHPRLDEALADIWERRGA